MPSPVVLTWILAAGCLVTAGLGFSAWRRPGSTPLSRLTDAAGGICLLLALLVWGLRWAEAGHLPLFGTYESGLSLAVAVLAAAQVARLRIADSPAPWPPAALVTAALLLHALGYDRTIYALTISERSWVVDVHSLLSWAAFALLVANAAFALYRVAARNGDHRRTDRALATTLSLGFLLHSAMLVSGSIYKFQLFGRAWSFDPVETLGFVAWIAYGTLLHLLLIAGWGGRRLAPWCLALFVVLTISYRGIVYFPAWSTYHIFDVDLRIHLTGNEPPPPGGP